MNPYHVLGIDTNASDAEIKAAYRSAVKKHHPGVTGKDETETIAHINEAYDILSDPARKRAYDSGIYQFIDITVPDEDPREVYRREYRRKMTEEKHAKLEKERKLFRRIYKINVFIFALSVIAVVDELLPGVTYRDHIVEKWETVRHVRGEHYYIPYIRTEHCTFTIPEGTNTALTVKGTEIMVEVSPLFRIPKEASVSVDGQLHTIGPSRTLYSFAIPLHYVVLVFAGLSVAMRRHSEAVFQFAFAPSLVFLLAVFIFYILT